jgi:hypothetical protein
MKAAVPNHPFLLQCDALFISKTGKQTAERQPLLHQVNAALCNYAMCHLVNIDRRHDAEGVDSHQAAFGQLA